MNVDALVNDADLDIPRRGTPVLPQMFDQPRRPTPTIPPGFTAPMAHKSITSHSTPPMSRSASSTITPAVPHVAASTARAATPQRPGPGEPVASATATTASTIKPSTPAKPSKKQSQSKQQLVSEAPKKKAAEVGQKEGSREAKEVKPGITDSPPKGTPKGKVGKKGKEAVDQNAGDEKDSKNPVQQTATPAPTSTKRPPPGKLDIAAATKLTEAEQNAVAGSGKPETPSKGNRVISLASASSVPPSPAVTATATGSPIKRTVGPRTLRVVPTPKTETPPASSASASLPQLPTVDKLRSRQASIASINQPGTPMSELISEDASVTSASVSRANSPPLIGGKVGSAPVRKKTKSQAKKERQERARQIIEEQAMALEKESEPEPVQAPIVGRKKKAKKPGAGPKVTPVPTPISPKPAASEASIEPESKPDVPNTTSSIKSGATKSTAPSPVKSKPSPQASPVDAKDKLNPTAQSIMADLQMTGELLASTLEFFKPLSSSLAQAHAARTAQGNASTAPQDLRVHFSEADLEALSKKQPVRLNGPDGSPDSRTLITPQGKFFWGLTQELEEKALELEKHIEELKGASRFHPRKPSTASHAHSTATHAQSKDVLPAIATALKEAGAKLGKSASGSSAGPLPPVQSSSDGDSGTSWPDLNKPTNKAGQELPPVSGQPQPIPQTPADAGAYLNQFVLPKTEAPLPNSTRTEMDAVGGPPGAGAANIAVNVNKIAKAAKAVAEGGSLSSELEGMGVMAADLLGGVVVQGLEALIGAGLGFNTSQDLGVDGKGNITLGGTGLDVQGLMEAIGSGEGIGGFAGASAARRGRRPVLSVQEAEMAMLKARRDHEAVEKKLAAVMKRNRKLAGAQVGKDR